MTSDRWDFTQLLRCADCPTGTIVVVRDIDRTEEPGHVEREFLRSLLMDGWRVLDRDPLCLPCHDRRLAAQVVAE